ncbi:hypothetical protein PV11_05739 [Exophiala sideris]|uniref:Uncharacterized protein n=1 Tax=Exophiala sideris TaxID=1016849 RepID=A0A0D1ZAC1_9EURO|nr:hypothetical protein PV11_05739 [Exophiala sideris]
MKTRFSNPNLRNIFPEQEEIREPIDEQSQASGGSEGAEQYQNIQHLSRQEASQTSGGPANSSQSVDEFEQGPSASAPQSPTEFYDALEETNAEQQSHSETGDTDFITPEQSPTKLAVVPVQRQQQQQQESAGSGNDSREPSSSYSPPQIQIQPPSPQVVTGGCAESDNEAESEADDEQGVSRRWTGAVTRTRSRTLPPPSVISLPENAFRRRSSGTLQLEHLPTPSYSPISELQTDPNQQDPPATSASPPVESQHHAIPSPFRLLLEPFEPSETGNSAAMSPPNNTNSSAAGQGHNANHVDTNQQATGSNTMPQGAAAPQASLTEEQVRALMMEDDDFDPIPSEYRQNPTGQFMPQATAPTSYPEYAQAYRTEAPYQAAPHYYNQGMASPYQYPPQQYVGAHEYGFPQPQYYAGYNNPLFADPRLAYTPPVGPRAQMAGPINTPPVGLPAQVAHPTGVLPYAQSPGGRVGVGGTPSPNRQGQRRNQDGAGGRMDGEEGDDDVVGGVALSGNESKN